MQIKFVFFLLVMKILKGERERERKKKSNYFSFCRNAKNCYFLLVGSYIAVVQQFCVLVQESLNRSLKQTTLPNSVW